MLLLDVQYTALRLARLCPGHIVAGYITSIYEQPHEKERQLR